MSYLIGLLFVTLAGLGTGTAAWPFKAAPELRQEKFLLFGIGTGLLVIPWLIVAFCIPDHAALIRDIGWRPLLLANAFSLSWGIANVLYVVCVLRIGAALTGALLSASALSVGVLLPLVIKGSGQFERASDLFSMTGALIFCGVFVVILGIVLVALAGQGREKTLKGQDDQTRSRQASGGFGTGLLLSVLAGLLSTGLSLGFVYGQGPIIDAVHKQGCSSVVATTTVWALAVIGGMTVNMLYAVVLLTKNGGWKRLAEKKIEIVYSILGGVQFIVSIVFLGQGMVLLGTLGASIGFGIQQSLQVIGNQLVGFGGGEWKGVYGRPRAMMYAAIAIILLAVVILSCSHFTGSEPSLSDCGTSECRM